MKKKLKLFILFIIGVIIIIFRGNSLNGQDLVRDNSVNSEVSYYSRESDDFNEECRTAVIYITSTGTKYHRGGCGYLKQSKIPVLLNKLDTGKYSPCLVCKPAVWRG